MKIVLVSALIVLTVLGSIGTVLPGIVQALAPWSSPSTLTQNPQCPPTPLNATTTSTSCSTNNSGSNTPQSVGADNLPNLSLPRSVLSSVDDTIGEGGVVQTSPDNLTLYNLGVRMRLLGGTFPHDKLLGSDMRVLSSMSFWRVEAQLGPSWLPLLPTSSNFTLLGTTKAGTSVVRTMEVRTGVYSGVLRIVYKALSSGPLKWDLEFTAGSAGQYRLDYSWWNTTSVSLLKPLLKQFETTYLSANYTLSWGDLPSSTRVLTSITPDSFLLSVDLGAISARSRVIVDPSIVSSNVAPGATAYSFQRKIFYEPKGGYYWAFYYDGFQQTYRRSQDGVTWQTDGSTFPLASSNGPAEAYLDTVINSGQTVIAAQGQIKSDSATAPYVDTISVLYSVGSIAGSTINWGQVQTASTTTGNCNAPQGTTCAMTLESRYVSITFGADGTLQFSYNLLYQSSGQTTNSCGSSLASAASAIVLSGNVVYCRNDISTMRPIVLPSSNDFGTSVVFQYISFSDGLRHLGYSFWTGTAYAVDDMDSGLVDSPEFSAVSDTNYGTHVVYRMTDGTISYAYRAASNSPWAPVIIERNIFSGSVAFPALTWDSSTNDVYAYALQGSSLMMRRKSLAQSWFDSSIAYVVTNRNSPANLGSNYVSVSGSATNSNQVLLFWTEGTGPYNAEFALIPVQTVWSPYSSPTDPWDSGGLAPYGQYFANLGEYVSPSVGLLTIRQTDLSIPGRELSLSIERTYTEPYSFLGSVPYNFESYPWAPLGDGWQLNFPWLNNTNHPLYVHLWNGEGYRIPSGFWIGSTAILENHQGENFRLIRNADGSINLYDKSGTSYTFGTNPNHGLVSIVDSTGQNTITFSYSNNLISCISDTVQRAFSFTYSGGLLQKISQVNGTCSSQGSSIRRVFYGNNGQSLTLVSDPDNRNTTYSYGTSPWLISQITYPTGWYDSYSFTGYTLGTQATTNRVSLQQVKAGSISIRQFAYLYTQGAGDQVVGSTVTSYNGTQIASYTKYAFSFLADIKNVTDANGNLLSGDEQFFGVNGQIPKDVVFVSDGQGHIGSYTNYFRYDLWGNLIYSRRVINPSSNWYHETFSDYYNNGLPLGFYSFAETLSQANHTRTDNNWNITSGQWTVVNGDYKLTGERGNQSLIEVPHGDASFQTTVRWLVGQYFEGYIGFRYQTNGNHYEVYLSAYDNTLRFVKATGGIYTRLQAATVTPSKNVYYVIRVESSGFTHTVYLNGTLQFQVTDQDSSMLMGRYLALGTYSSTSPTNAEQIGFSNIYVQPLSGTFSNSFFSTSPNSNLHGDTAGIAELQNGIGTLPEETYYSYYPWGAISQTKNRYDPPAPGPGSNPPALDVAAQNFCSNAYASCSIGFSTSRVGDLVIVYTVESLSGGGCTFRVSDTAGLSWTSRGGIVSGNGGRDEIQEFWAWSAGPLSSDTITESISGCGTSYNGLMVFGITGANPSVPFDSGPLPASASGNSGGASVSISTSSANDMVFGGIYHGGGAATAGAGFTLITSNGGAADAAEYKVVITGLANFPVTFGDSVSAPWEEIADAVQPAGSTLPTQWLTTVRTYDTYGNPKTLTDPWGNVTSYGYSSKYFSAYLTSRNQTLVPGGALISTRYGYSFTVGTMLNSTDPNGYTTTYNYDVLGRPTRVTYQNGNFVVYSYNDLANYVDITNENGWKTRQIYDGIGQLSTTDRFLGGLSYSNETRTYNWLTKLTSKTDPLGNKYVYQYDPLGRITSVLEANGNSTQTVYNDLASWVRTTDENGVYRCEVYDRLGRLISAVENSTSTCQSGIVSNYYYDETGNLATIVTSRLQSTSYAYDNLNRLIKTSYPDRTFELYTYDADGNLITKTDRKGVQTAYSYDSLNRVTAITYSGTTTTRDLYTYDQNSNLLQLQSQNATIGYTYDSRNRMLSETYTVNTGFNITSSPTSLNIAPGSQGSSTIALTSVNGFAGTVSLSYSAPSGITVSFSPNSVPLPQSGSASSKATVSVASTVFAGTYTVTVTGSSGNPGMLTSSVSITINVIGFTMSLNPTLVGEYCNPLGCPYSLTTSSNLTITSISGFSGTVSLSYIPPNPSAGSSVTGPSSVYVPSGGSAKVTLNATPPTKTGDYYWTIKGQSGTYTNSTTLDVYYYSCSRNCPLKPATGTSSTSAPASSTSSTSSSTSISYTVSYTYNGEVVNATSYPDGLVAKYVYDLLGRVTTVSPSGSTGNYATFTYNTSDQPATITFGNGLIGTYSYDKLSRPSQITLTNAGTQLLSLSYSYSKTGTVSSVTGAVNSTKVNEQYSYDVLQRLTSSLVQSGSTNTTLSYTYDTVGNRLSQNLNSVLTSYFYNVTNNELTSYSTPNSTTTYAYDPNGNLRTKTVTTPTTVSSTYTWDASNHLLRVTAGSLSQGVYAYDGSGRRVESVESTTMLYAYAGTESLYELVPGTSNNDYVYAAGMRIARVSGATTNYYHTDGLGSTRLVTDSSKNVLFSDNYQPYGQDNGTPKGTENYRFTGKPYSSSIGLYYEFHRWYDPAIGRFISQDPRLGRLSNPQTQNRYAYVVNNPLEYNDPSGEFLNIIIGAIAGAVIGYGACVWATGGWTSTQCGIAAGAGAVAGAVAGATFNPVLGAVAYAGLTGATAAVAAGAIAGAAGGVASYVATGGLTTATGGKFEWSASGLGQSAAIGALGGALGGGLGYGAGRLISSLGGVGEEGTGAIENAAAGLAPGESGPTTELSSGAVLRRVWGGPSKPFGSFWTTLNPRTPDIASEALDLPSSNTMRGLVTAYFPAGTPVTIGRTSGDAIEIVIRGSWWRAAFPGLWSW